MTAIAVFAKLKVILATRHFGICHSERFDGANIPHLKYFVDGENAQEHVILVKNLDGTGRCRPFESDAVAVLWHFSLDKHNRALRS